MRVVLAVLLAFASPHVLGAQPTSPPDAIALARRAIEQLTKGEFAAVVATFDDKMRAGLPEEKLRATWEGALAQFGALQRTGEPRVGIKGDFQIVVIPLEFERANLEMLWVYSAQGRVGGLAIRPPAQATAFTDASYVMASAFTERPLTVDAGGWPLPATLAMPVGRSPVPAIVLVHGSGPQDRDATIGRTKFFRDLALGLASRGIAVLRYVKRTREYGEKISTLTHFTVKDEAIDDAVAAVRLMKATPGIDPARVYVLGHSLGAMLAPRIAAATDITGLILMAPGARSITQTLIDQSRYLAQSDGTVSPNEQANIAHLEQLAATVTTLKPGDPPPASPGLRAPTSYWIDLREMDPLADIRAVTDPVLVLHGARDYQVTTDDFEKWRGALSSRKETTFKLYPALNHLFITGTGPSLPTDYQSPGHVDEEVVRDIAAWISARSRAR